MLPFVDRAQAADALADALASYRGCRPLVLAIPRGAVPMARIIADRLHGQLDVILVRKLGAPGNPEYAIGAVDEFGRIVEDSNVQQTDVIPRAWIDTEARRQVLALHARRQAYAGGRPSASLQGRSVIVVDDGMATGNTMLAALHAARAERPARLVCAAAVASHEAIARARKVADEVVVLATPDPFIAVGQHYVDFSEVDDVAVREALQAEPPPEMGGQPQALRIPSGESYLSADLALPSETSALVIFAHGSGSSRRSVRNRTVAWAFNGAGSATLLVDLLLPAEHGLAGLRFDVPRLSQRLSAVLSFVQRQPQLKAFPKILFGASTGAAAALRVAALRPQEVAAVVSRGGRVDLAGDAVLRQIAVPVLLMVGSLDTDVLLLNEQAKSRIGARAELDIIEGAGHLFEEPGMLQHVAAHTARWLKAVLASEPSRIAQGAARSNSQSARMPG